MFVITHSFWVAASGSETGRGLVYDVNLPCGAHPISGPPTHPPEGCTSHRKTLENKGFSMIFVPGIMNVVVEIPIRHHKRDGGNRGLDAH